MVPVLAQSGLKYDRHVGHRQPPHLCTHECSRPQTNAYAIVVLTNR